MCDCQNITNPCIIWFPSKTGMTNWFKVWPIPIVDDFIAGLDYLWQQMKSFRKPAWHFFIFPRTATTAVAEGSRVTMQESNMLIKLLLEVPQTSSWSWSRRWCSTVFKPTFTSINSNHLFHNKKTTKVAKVIVGKESNLRLSHMEKSESEERSVLSLFRPT